MSIGERFQETETMFRRRNNSTKLLRERVSWQDFGVSQNKKWQRVYQDLGVLHEGFGLSHNYLTHSFFNFNF